jgi:hypothetical protein
MERFEVIDTYRFLEIRDAEIGILSHLRDDREFLNDEYGDVIYDDNGPVVDTSIVVQPQELRVQTRNIFASMLNGSGLSDLVNPKVIDGYNDVFGIDRQLLSDTIDGYTVGVLGYYIDDVYQGCCWFFTSAQQPGYLGIYGIRSSVANTLLGVRGFSRKMFTFLINNHDGQVLPPFTTIVVPWPLDPIPGLLLRLGFTEHNVPYDFEGQLGPIQTFLSPIATTSNYFTLNV